MNKLKTLNCWLPSSHINDYPELHSTSLEIVRLLVAVEGQKEAWFGWFNPEADRWWIECSPSKWTITHFMPLPSLPREIKESEKPFPVQKYSKSELKSMLRAMCQDWADDHTHLQKLCREVGYSDDEVDGNSYGVPDIIELADMLRAKIIDK